MFRKTYAEINLNHLAHNVRWMVSKLNRDQFFCPMIKANAYGHGAVEVALYLESIGIRHLGVCLLEEALQLRSAGVKAPILFFRGFDRDAVDSILQYDLTPAITSLEQIQYLTEKNLSRPLKVHLKFDTGMNRMGFREEQLSQVHAELKKSHMLEVEGILTHLACGEDAADENGFTSEQLKKLLKIKVTFNNQDIKIHALNSAGFMNWQATKNNWTETHPLAAANWGVRPGIMTYGYSPLPELQNEIKPVLSLKSVISQLRWIQAGETVSYNRTWKASRKTLVGVVPVGYGDGYHRILSHKSKVIVNGCFAPVIGNVCMDYMMVDLTDVSDSEKLMDAEVVLIGKQNALEITAQDLAALAGTISYEILTSVGERVPRVYVREEYSKPHIVSNGELTK